MRAATWGRPYGWKQTDGVGSAKVGAEGEPHQKQILHTQAPSGAERERRQAFLVLRAGTIATFFRRGPRKWGSRGRLPLSRGDGRRPEGIGTGEYEREALILSSPLGASLASFWASRKKLAAPAAKFPCAKPPRRRVQEAAPYRRAESLPHGRPHRAAPTKKGQIQNGFIE